MPAAVEVWSSPTTLYAGGLRQVPVALGGRPMVLIADQRLESQVDAVLNQAPAVATIVIAGDGSANDAEMVRSAIGAHPAAVPVALGGGSVMDVVRLQALIAVDPQAKRWSTVEDGVAFLATRAVNPAVCIPSTIGTAAEVSPVAVRRGSAGTAMMISPGLRSSAAVFDPQVTGSLPPAALAAGLVEPWARVCISAISGPALRLQDGIVRGLASTILELGDEVSQGRLDESWRSAAALASAQTHLGLTALGRPPAGHHLWPLATEVMRAIGWSKAAALACLVPAWLRCLDSGVVGRSWGATDRVQEILGFGHGGAAVRLENWLTGLGLPTTLPPDIDLEAIVARVVNPWQASGIFLAGVPRAEIGAVMNAACRPG